jgi:RNA polymerase sigma factor (sigma-70 family)
MISEKAKLKVIIDGFLRGESKQYRILLTKVTQYVYHQYHGIAFERDDLISEILAALLDNFRKNRFKGDNIRALSVYIYKIIRNQISHAARHRNVMLYTDKDLERVDKRRSPADEIVDREFTQQIYRELDSACRELLKLKFEENWSDQEIADHMEKSKNATSTAISRCLKRVQGLKIVKEML